MTDTTTTRQPATLAELLDDLPHWRMKLARGTDDCHRPDLSTWADNEDGRAFVTLAVGPLLGQQQRFVDLSPAEARDLARNLIRTADEIDHLRGRVAADAVRAAGGDAMTAAMAHIDATFAEA